MLKNIGNFVTISFISIVIYVFYSSQYPGGVAGMAPFILIITMPIAGIITLLIILLLSKKIVTKYLLNIFIFTIICFLILIFYFQIIPFSVKTESPYRELDNWCFLSILIPVILLIIISKIVVEEKNDR